MREAMVERQILPSDIEDAAILAAMRVVPRHLFVPEAVAHLAYDDTPVEIGFGQTISQPYVVAKMIQTACIEAGDRVLDVGTGSGYQAAVLAQMGCRVYTIEIVPELAERAKRALDAAGYAVEARVGDGWDGWPEAAPFDAILCAAAPTTVPDVLPRQLGRGRRMVLPVGDHRLQRLVSILRTGEDTFEREDGIAVLFVPMTGKARR